MRWASVRRDAPDFDVHAYLQDLVDLGIELSPVVPRQRGRIYAVGTHKGGVGKSTTSSGLGKNLAAALSKTHAVESATLRGQMAETERGFLSAVRHLQSWRLRGAGDHQSVSKRRILMVDLDSQSNLKGYLGAVERVAADPDEPGYTLMEVLKGERSAKECIVKVPGSADHLWLLPSARNLTELEPLLWGKRSDAKDWVVARIEDAVVAGQAVTLDMIGDWKAEAAIKEHASMQILRDALEPLLDEFELVIIDLPPARSRVTLAGLASADEVIIVTDASEVSKQAIGDFMDTIKEAKQYNEDLNVFGILVTKFRSRPKDELKLMEIRQEFGKRVFDTVISDNPKIEDAFGRGIPMSKQTTKKNYGELAREFIAREREGLPGFFAPFSQRDGDSE
jgi:cellulose biosynthesis protein BcsQ